MKPICEKCKRETEIRNLDGALPDYVCKQCGKAMPDAERAKLRRNLRRR